MKRGLLALTVAAMLASVGGCTQAQLQREQLVFADAQSTLTSAQNALDDYGIAKGIAQVAQGGLSLAGQTVLAAGLGTAIAAADMKATQLQAAVTASTLDLANIKTLVAQINAQVQSLRLKAAPSIQVVATPTVPPAPPVTGVLVN